MDAEELWEYFTGDRAIPVEGRQKALKAVHARLIGEFYAYYQWFYGIPSAKVIAQVPLEFLEKAYFGLHDLDLELAVRKVGKE